MLDSRLRGRRFEPQGRHCLVSLSKNIDSNLVLVQPRKIRPFITERLLMGCKETNQTNKQSKYLGFGEANLTLVLLNLDISFLENYVDPDQLASDEAI